MSHFPRPFLRIIKGLSRATHKTANRTGNKQILLKCVSKLEDDHSKKLKLFLILGRGLIFAASLKQNRQFPVNFQLAHFPFESLYDSSFKSQRKHFLEYKREQWLVISISLCFSRRFARNIIEDLASFYFPTITF